ncbi:unnamed protein product [Urochloa decumbens]|uniref:AAA+ ATPase domain-containing protein n=1 Tax=Urochloa decumbens TaxID=240449 RepID=A0ABC9B171_9POAL
MDLVAGALGSVIRKLGELLQAEYKLHKGLSEQIESLKHELESAQMALRKVGEVLPEQLDLQVRLWACEVREASYDMEDILDIFLVEVAAPADEKKDRLLRRLKKNIADLFNKTKAHHTIAGAIEDMKKRLQEVKDRRDRYSVVVALPAPPTPDPRLADMHKEAAQLIGIDSASAKLIDMLLSISYCHGDANVSGSRKKMKIDSSNKMKIVSVVGVGGLGKTTLAKAVYDELKSRYDYGAFLSVGRKPDLVQVFHNIFFLLDRKEYEAIREVRSLQLLVGELKNFLQNKRYFIVIDDVWDVLTWKTIKLSLVENDSGSRVITTTRNRDVASSEVVYELDPLSSHNSKTLFYTRLFGVKGECPANHPAEASEKILKKCGGVPLAIITMASLLVGKSREEWSDVCNYPGFCGGNGNQQVEDTEWILSLSYYDLPSYLKTCLLYLSVYPEDHEIKKDSLIWKWIAEGFVVEKKIGTSQFEQGEEYFNQLINRSMIQAIESKITGVIYGCRVHDVVLDLIRGLSDKENFVTISNDDEGTSSSRKKVRRLAHQNRMIKQTQQEDHIAMAQVRSFTACSCNIDNFVLHPGFKLLRVLDLERCRCENEIIRWQGLKHLGNLIHLKYLGLRHTHGIHKLPEEIGKLKFLQILDLEHSGVEVVPLGICQLTQLACLRGGPRTRAPDGFFLTKLTLLEELSIRIDNLDDDSPRQFMKDVGNLSKVRQLNISARLKGMVQTDLVESLGNLHKLQHLQLADHNGYGQPAMREWDTVVLPRHLQSLVLYNILFSSLPSCISPTHLPILNHLWLEVDDMDEPGLRALGGLPELCILGLPMCRRSSIASSATVANITGGDAFFQKLRYWWLYVWMVQLVLNEDSTSVSFAICNRKGARSIVGSKTEESSRSVAPLPVMPNLQELRFEVPVSAIYKDANGGCDNLRLECLPSLRRVEVYVDCDGASADDVEKAEAELRHATQLHPNRPIIEIYRINVDKMMGQSTDQHDEEVPTSCSAHTDLYV